MWVPLLIAGAAIAGVIVAKHMIDSSVEEELLPPGTDPPPDPPPGVINISTSEAKSFYNPGGTDLVWVHVWALRPGASSDSYGGVRAFTSTQDAAVYFDSLTRFFDKNHEFWTCAGGVVWIEMWGFSEEYGTRMLPGPINSERWDTCRGVPSKMARAPSIPDTVGSATSKPVHIVSYEVSGTYSLSDSFMFSTDSEAELYYRLLRAYFAQPIIHKAYTDPKGTIVLGKYGTPPSQARFSVWEDGLELDYPEENS